MRSLLSEGQNIGLLLFDEPSAALDPTAEHGTGNHGMITAFVLVYGQFSPDLFARLKNLRGKKTMIFSSHRFGQLTRPADMIL